MTLRESCNFEVCPPVPPVPSPAESERAPAGEGTGGTLFDMVGVLAHRLAVWSE
jgi:hypothetical protein